MRPSELLRIKRPLLLQILACYDVSEPMVFGSVARGEDNEESDLDLFVTAGDGMDIFTLCELQCRIQDAMGIKVDFFALSELRSDVREAALEDAIPL